MDNNIDRTGPKMAFDQMSDQAVDDQALIYLPAIEGHERKSASHQSSLHNSRAKKKPAPSKKPAPRKKKTNLEKSETTASPELQATADYLPEYHSQTNGLRELLSTIDPDDRASRAPRSPQKTSFEAQLEANLIENAMHLPHSRSGLPGSSDLPIGPTRWGLYLSGMVGTLAFLFVFALAYAHLSSPTGIDWAKAKTGTAQMWHRLAAVWSREKPHKPQPSKSAEISLPEPLHIDKISDGTLVATASRISTTAVTPKKGSITTPSEDEIFLSQKELEEQILSLEAKQAGPKKKHRVAADKHTRIARLAPQRTTPADQNFTHGKSADFDQLVVIPSTKINPDMETQIFQRAKSYLQQHDISSARMILQYAASLGSGLSAMALAETFDPNFTTRINLPNVDSSRPDARKWYYMASRLGIKEADARLSALN